MKNTIEDLKHYLHETLNVQTHIQPWDGQGELLFFLRDLYDFYEITLLQQRCLLIIAKEGTESTPVTVSKHCAVVAEKWPGIRIYVDQNISSHNRKRLIQHQVPFIIPGNQMYLPDLGIDLREHLRKLQKNTKKIIMPATQAAIIYALSQEAKGRLIPSKLATELGYTRMTMTRAFNELKTMGIGEVHKQGKGRSWTFESKKELWNQAKPMMNSPVENRFWLLKMNHLKEHKILAGLSALSHYSMLNSPHLPIYAIHSTTWKKLKLPKNEILFSSEEATGQLEVWNYNPALFGKEYVDPFSLCLSFRDSRDERIESALEEMMEGIQW